MIESIAALYTPSVASAITATCTATKFYIFWATLHWASIQLYQEYCSPKTFVGWAFGPVASQVPHCKVLSWIQRTSTDAFNSMTAVVITWGASFASNWITFT